jgi:hypothetical protein
MGDQVDANDRRGLDVGGLDLNDRGDQRRAGVDGGVQVE